MLVGKDGRIMSQYSTDAWATKKDTLLGISRRVRELEDNIKHFEDTKKYSTKEDIELLKSIIELTYKEIGRVKDDYRKIREL